MRLIDADKLKAHYAWWGNDGAEYRERKADFDVIIDLQPTVEPKQIYHEEWRPLEWKVEETVCDIPWEYDGKWIIVTDGINISVERIKKDAFDHFFPTGRWFDLTDTKAWRPMPEPFARMDEVEE